MPNLSLTRRTLTGLLATAPLAARAQNQPSGTAPSLELVASFAGQVTGVAVAPSGRMFVNFPRWEQDVPISVAEVTSDGALRPYPNAEWNRWTDAAPLSNPDHLICVQSITVDSQGFLWILDPAAPGNEFNLDGGPKALKVDLSSDRVVRVYPFNRNVCPQGSYLNDIRLSPDGRTAYLSDSGVRGALLVLDVGTGQVRRLLDGHPSTQVEKTVKVAVEGKPLKRADGRGPMFAADGIAASRDGTQLYWQALTGRTLYRIPTGILRNPSLTPAAVAGAVERLGTTCVADGYWIDRQDRLWITSPEDNSVKRRLPTGNLQTVVQDPRLRWPDSMAEGGDGSIYVTASHIQDMAQFTGAPRQGKTELFRFSPPG
jgi:sugar lactone lactonase YvrE